MRTHTLIKVKNGRGGFKLINEDQFRAEGSSWEVFKEGQEAKAAPIEVADDQEAAEESEDAQEAPDDEGSAEDLMKLTKAELLELAGNAGVDADDSMTKAVIVGMLIGG